jgi:nucleoside-diphosphate-sugar epimerase
MKILISGACGFVGLAISEYLLKQAADLELLSITALPPAARRRFDQLPGRYRLHHCDVTDTAALEAVFNATKPQRLVHGAALTTAASLEAGRIFDTVQVNVIGTINMLEAALRHRIERFVFLSSSSVYGANAFEHAGLDEVLHTPAPQTVYPISKFAAEKLSLRYRETAGLNVVAPRLSTVFGPWEYRSGARDTLSAPYQTMQLALESDVEAKTAVIPRRGHTDWIYSRDVAAAVAILLQRDAAEPAVVNIAAGPGRGWPIEDWCTKLASAFPNFSYYYGAAGADGSIDFHNPRDRAPLANRRLLEEIGFHPHFGLHEAFDDYLAWARAHRDLLLQ